MPDAVDQNPTIGTIAIGIRVGDGLGVGVTTGP